MKTKKTILIVVIIVAVIAIISCVILMHTNDNVSKKENDTNKQEEKNIYLLSDLDFLNDINTNDIFYTLDDEVNSELIDTYAFKVSTNMDETQNIVAVKTDNTTVNIATTEYSDWGNGINNLFYSDGNLYYEYDDNTIWKISLSDGNGNYKLNEYKFLEGYIYDNAWFYIKGNEVYYFNNYALYVCDLTTEECQEQVLDIRQSFDIEIDNKKINLEFDKVYIEDDTFIYIMSDDEENIYRIDVNNPKVDDTLLLASYTKVDEIGKNARLLSENSKLVFENIKFDYEYDESSNFFIEYKSKRYNLKDNNYRPITLLPNNYLMVEHFTNEESFVGEIEYINLKTKLKDENYFLDYNEWYGDELYFITQ